MGDKKTFSKFRLWCNKPVSFSPSTDKKLLDPALNSSNRAFLIDVPTIHHQEDNCQLLKDAVCSQKNFLSLFGLVTSETSAAKIQEKEKRLCSSPHFLSLLLQAEKQDLDGIDLDEVKSRKRSKNGDNAKRKSAHILPDSESKIPLIEHASNDQQVEMRDYHEELCHVCHQDGELLLCDSCSYVYHLSCAGLSEIPIGKWFCKLCQNKLSSETASNNNDQSSVQELNFERQSQLKQAYLLRTEKERFMCRVQEIFEVLEHKHDLERSYTEKIEQARQLKEKIDSFLMQL